MNPASIILSGARCFVEGAFETCSIKLVNGFVREIAPSISATSKDLFIPLEGTVILPGLINSHDHLEFNLFKRIGTPPYQNYVAWGDDIHKNHAEYIREVVQVPLRLRLLWGAYKNIFSGVTTVIHHNNFYFDFRWGYPLEVFRKYSWIHSLALDVQLEAKLKSRNGRPCIIHLAEGVDSFAKTELSRLVELGGLSGNTVLVHGIGLSASDIDLIEKAGASLIWCPSSNDFLFQHTAPIEQALDKIRIALGTDSTLTGNASLFDEIRCAVRLRDVVPLKALAMVTSVPANIFGIERGAISVGRAADLLLYDCELASPLEGFLGLDIGKIKCLMRRGVPLYGDSSFVKSLGGSSWRYAQMEASSRKKLVRGDLERLMLRITRYLPSFDFNGLPIKLDLAS